MTDPAEPLPYRELFFTAEDGLRLYYRDYDRIRSDRPVALCLPGLARNSKDFDALALWLARDRRVIAPDYRGRGRSAYDPDWRRYHARTYLNDLRHLLIVASVHRCVAIGTSLGGIMAMALGVLMPTVLAAAVLNDVGPDLPPAGLGRILSYLSQDRPQPDWPAAALTVRRLLPQLALETDEGWMRVARATYRAGADGLLHFDWDPHIVRPILADRSPRPDLWPLFRSLRRVPVLALRGGMSDILTRDTFERMAAEHPDLIRVEAPGVGHAPTLDEPQLREAIDEFLGRC
jgi:pimeloyl-ACP methyl ester carboxylesterase